LITDYLCNDTLYLLFFYKKERRSARRQTSQGTNRLRCGCESARGRKS